MSSQGGQKYKGQCLCGAVAFKVIGRLSDIYQCHCSECRKITGSSANASCIAHDVSFFWTRGEFDITSYTHTSGYRSDFCRYCGALVPNKIKDAPLYWIPVGALEATSGMEVKAHLCVSSRADWETSLEAGIHFSDMPCFQELLAAIGMTEGTEG